ncbi:transmembrane protein, putative (macronuclear) [Tetrahymena thermophila SB210]|uniref:Transmembrane protein, putative n=1 Tax=Tetrahymena thermophila (strain SB210) TaxID=312017 RepID=Q22U52_TETTS|nr:transmembrane protein, putative [Tetrahymena thermophila SB210]EAR88835.3 transmembrane protein, putative [Tetrahymena thermophila SB210]|eukprot:XP_001009080.3 transmembrane protein, putative [Tetrahymena thermophila SB210]
MEKIVQLLEKNKKLVGLTAAAAAAVGLIYYLTQKGEKVEQTTQRQDDEAGSTNESQYLQKARQIAKKITVKTLGDTKNYDMNTISQVMEYSLELADQEYVDLTLKNRFERREKMDTDINEYEKLVLQYNEDVENTIKKAQTAILEILEISYDDFEESVISFMEKGHYQEIYMFQAAIRQKIKEKIKPTKNLGIDDLKNIITFQLNLLQQQPELLKSIVKKLSQQNETVQLIPVILGTLINDYIYKEYQVEEEDQMQIMAQPSVLENTDIIILIQQVEQAMFNAMGSMGSNMEGFFQ